MKRVLLPVVLAILVCVASAPQAHSRQTSKEIVPIAQALVREGDFAVELARELGLGAFDTEIDAESSLGDVGVAPRNGWMSDYPVTPVVVGELQSSIGEAAASGRLPLTGRDALAAFSRVCSMFELPIRVADGSLNGTPVDSNRCVEEEAVEGYYTNEGPPVISYCSPPWDYYYLYDWVPYPFWYSGLLFPGFFILDDFDVVVHHHGYRRYSHRTGFSNQNINNYRRITNHRLGANGRVFRVDPRAMSRQAINATGTNVNSSRATSYSATNARSARAILDRDSARVADLPRNMNRATNGVAPDRSRFDGNRAAVGGPGTLRERGNPAINRPFAGPRQPRNNGGIASMRRPGFRGSTGYTSGVGGPRSPGAYSGSSNRAFSGGFGGGRGNFSGGVSRGGFSGGMSRGGFSGGMSRGGGFGGGGGRAGGFGGGARR